MLTKRKKEYLGIHSEIPINGLGPIKESVSVVGEAAVHTAAGVEVGAHGFGLPGCLHPGDPYAVQQFQTLNRESRCEKSDISTANFFSV